MLIRFIYTNKEEEESNEIFINLFCESGIFNQIIDAIDRRIEKMGAILHFGN